MTDPKRNIRSAGDLLRRGATLLKEPCEKCGGLQFQYQGKTSCLNCDELSELENTEPVAKSQVEVGSLSSLINSKMEKASTLLANEDDLEKQIKLSDLILRYIEILGKLSTVKKD